MITTTPACGHRLRYATPDGRTLCEECARLESGWKTCLAPRCKQTSPDRFCTDHAGKYSECEDCDNGSTDCEELDCHGTYCEEGVTDCASCGGTGIGERVLEGAS